MHDTKRHQRLGGLDGLRAIAVGLVLVYHLFPPFMPGGFLGVDVFFTISGFLIATLLMREHDANGRISLVDFWRRRARRLLPALALVVAVTTSASFIIGGDLLYHIRQQVVGAMLFVSNWVFISFGTDYFAQDTPELLRNTWSLAIEEQFYLLLPLFLIVLLRKRRRALVVAVFTLLGTASALLMARYSLTSVDATRIYFGSDSHVFGLLLGVAVAALLYRSPNTEAKALTGVAAALNTLIALAGLGTFLWLSFTLVEASNASFEGGFQLATLAALTTVAAVTRPGAPLARALDIRPLAYIGERSYGIYLWHWPLLLLVRQALGPAAGLATPTWAIGLITLALTLIASDFSFRYVETPIRRHGLRTAWNAFWGALAGRMSRPISKRRALAFFTATMLAVPLVGGAFLTAPTTTSSEEAIERGRDAATAVDPAPAPRATTATGDPDATANPTEGADTASPSSATDVAVEGAEPFTPDPLNHGLDLTAVGDSVMLASAPELSAVFSGVDIDAEVSRGLGYAVTYVEELAAAGALRPIIVIGLGTNGPISDDDLAAIASIADHRRIILVNAFADRWWVPEVNEQLTTFADEHRGVVIADWNSGIAPRPELLAGDLVHPHPEGGELYASVIADAIVKLDAEDERVGFGVPRR